VITEARKLCPKCRQEVPLSCFNKDAKAPDGLKYYCRLCCCKEHASYRAKHGKSALNRAEKYGLPISDVNKIMAVPVCQACCRDLPDSHSMKFDHCHQGGHFRGVLCHACNVACAGTSEEVVTRLRACVDYCLRDMERNEQT
jgi:hypothetical protein